MNRLFIFIPTKSNVWSEGRYYNHRIVPIIRPSALKKSVGYFGLNAFIIYCLYKYALNVIYSKYMPLKIIEGIIILRTVNPEELAPCKHQTLLHGLNYCNN